MYEIKIYHPSDLSKRAYINIKIDTKWIKEYNGNRINISIHPNRAKTIKERNSLLKKLEFEFLKCLQDGSYQEIVAPTNEVSFKLRDLLETALQHKLSSNLTPKYIKQLQSSYDDFIEFLTEKELSEDIKHLSILRVQSFLDQFRTTPTFYMSRRRELSSLFNYIKKTYEISNNPFSRSHKIKIKAVLHATYTKKQLNDILAYLKAKHENLYLCCLISYGCFLRPHIEVRNLMGIHFKADFTEIHLAGNENKSGRVRVVAVPDYVKAALIERCQKLQPDTNLFSLLSVPYNNDYFKTAWARLRKEMRALGILEDNQTMYSFRHSAAVNVYKQTKDLHLLQQLLGHSNMMVTLKYLRGLGIHNASELRQVMPKL